LAYDHEWEEQFKNPEKIPVEGGEMKVIDLKPEQVRSEVPVVYMRGWATTADIYKGNLKEIARDGRRALVVDQAAGIDMQNLPDQERTSAESMKDVIPMAELELRKVAAFLKLIDTKELDQVDLVMHSEGAIYGAFAAILCPDRIRDLVFIDPAGMVGRENNVQKIILRSLLDFNLQLGHALKNVHGNPEEIKKVLSSQKEKWFKAFAENPRHIAESVPEITKTEIQDLLSILHQLGKKIAIIHGADDKMFTTDSVQKRVDPSMIDGFYSVEGTHESSFMDPMRMSKVITNALNSLEALTQRAEELPLQKAA
jgi:pimeloyl-ACP methyl ester carboxylesterase